MNRPVRVPIGHLAAFCWCLLASTLDDEVGFKKMSLTCTQAALGTNSLGSTC